MITKCPECDLPVSDKAVSCPHCGYPMQPNIQRKPKKSNKRRRLPNGFGQISEIKGRNLRKPFRAMVCVGKKENGRPICKPLKPQAYFETYNDAYAALLEYNKNPYDIESTITMSELYDRWFEYYRKTLHKEHSTNNITSAWKYCSDIYDMRVVDVRVRHIKNCIEFGTREYKGEERTPSYNVKKNIKSVFNLMFDYAVEYEIVDRNYARSFDISKIAKAPPKDIPAHIIYTDDEINTLWEHVDDTPYADVLLIQCYSGWRPQELGLIELKNVDLDKWLFSGGLKTDAGKNRIVPIHPKIRELVVKKYKEAEMINSKYLINHFSNRKTDHFLSYSRYNYNFMKLIDSLNLNPSHRSHDGRKHFVTMAKKYKLDEYAIKYIVGHAITDLTENTYTEREIDWLIEEMKKIK